MSDIVKSIRFDSSELEAIEEFHRMIDKDINVTTTFTQFVKKCIYGYTAMYCVNKMEDK